MDLKLYMTFSMFIMLSMCGRKPILSHEETLAIFNKYKDIVQKLNFCYDARVYENIVHDINKKVTPKGLHLAFKRLRPQQHQTSAFGCDLVKNIEQKNDTTHIPNETEKNVTWSENDDPDYEEEIVPNICTHNLKMTYTFTVDVYESIKLSPVNKVYNRIDGKSPYRIRKVLPKFQWSTLLREKIWECSRVLCTIQFRYQISQEFILFTGKCTQCPARFNLKTEKTTKKIYEMKCDIFNYDEKIKHEKQKKIRMTPYAAEQYKKLLQHNPAVIVRNRAANDRMKIYDKEPTTVPSLNSLRLIRHKLRKERWLDSDVILSVIKMAHGPYRSVIKHVSVAPNFDIYYGVKNQTEYYMQCNSVFPITTMVINATGSLYHPVVLKTGEKITKRLFLYVALITGNGNVKAVPVAQRISDSHTSDSIFNWLRNFSNNVEHVKPSEIVTNDSSALIAAAVKAFTPFATTREYLESMYSVLSGKSKIEKHVYLRIDTSHFIKTIKELSCWAGVEDTVREFYVQCLKLIKESDDFEVIKCIIKNMLIITLSKYKCNVYENAKKTIDALIKKKNTESNNTTRNPDPDNSSDYSNLSTRLESEKYEDFENTDMLKWFDDIVADIKGSVNLDTDSSSLNGLYCPHFVTTLRRLMPKLPMWSNIMMIFFNSLQRAPTSSAVECYFKILKNYVAKTKLLKCRIDEFLQIHAEYLQGELKLGFSNLTTTNECTHSQIPRPKRKRVIRKKVKTVNASLLKKTKDIKRTLFKKSNEKNKIFSQDSIFADTPSFVENWGGEENKPRNKKTHQNRKPHPVMLVGNGSINGNVKIINTCAVDSVLHLIAYACSKYQNAKNLIDGLKESIIKSYIQKLRDMSTNTKLLINLRSEICMQYFQQTRLLTKGTLVDCHCTIAYIFENILATHDIFSSEYNKICKNCYKQIIKPLAFISLDTSLLSEYGMQSLEECVSPDMIASEIKSQCSDCKGEASFWYDINDLITFELTGPNPHDSTIKSPLGYIPEKIIIKGKLYTIVGAIEFLKPISKSTSIGHYRCHLYDSNSWICYDDLNLKLSLSPDSPIDITTVTYALENRMT